MLGLFAASHMDYEIDRNATEQPSLGEMVSRALTLLAERTKDGDRGFFLLIEGSRIDMAAHNNDAAGVVHDVIAFNEAVRVARQFADARSDTLLLSTADHETGGLVLDYQVRRTRARGLEKCGA